MANYNRFGPVPKFDFEHDIDEEDLIRASQAAEALLNEEYNSGDDNKSDTRFVKKNRRREKETDGKNGASSNSFIHSYIHSYLFGKTDKTIQ